ncbi:MULTISPECIES: tRNA lysidine(34) synthetase TilS [unclassified Arthrobacter]|uniref:tRNA lysidine(34) synthetase TilS n=1 Tax=unclassified Arthrobacter TaxID=235627 RepID=UPI001D13803E|nr:MULTISPECIES: tRNA lysidine(34) synthetase TilS [unclassified Arthrobacter]MCC3275796.1 tRNA lysidine(34) synthetase TilS [Arthrobacter sp. zg-Y20]MCC3278779.1 tRNA lysidine(34) synthetase TilS [Arthrobacter sp. zg-Y40]MCC9177153.1 tRNA lysidine(34) synthetase TilS [Arthrobacter sp. zg-Y750]MDK1315953.1 tRNA lysidine(34) synthetase TilS [Arthrobacter sp. zg.Y20]MDK1326148.1 tRNA lysidine(34) synthetase TilS [Arthrobacter sp. zg-Y1143]
MSQRAPRVRKRLLPTLGNARNAVRDALRDAGLAPGGERPPLILVACSGGPDSLALAEAASFFARRGDYRVGAVVVDHGLQEGSAEVAAQARGKLERMGLDPVLVRRVTVPASGMGPEAAARTVRYAALDAAAAELGASAVLLGHTLDDQAEQVLLGLMRGSGTRSLAGMPAVRGIYLRPFLGLRREQTLEICAHTGLDPWQDPSNSDPAYARSRVRTEVLPFLEEKLGPGIAEALFRSSRILSADADYMDAVAARTFEELRAAPPAGEGAGAEELLLPEAQLRGLAPAVRQRVLALAALALGGAQPSYERLAAVESLLRRTGSAGPVQLVGKVSVYRQPRSTSVHHGTASYGNLVFRKKSST